MPDCFFARLDEPPCDWRADGNPDRAHLIPKQRMRIRKLSLYVIWDPRAWVPACRRHHHRFDNHFFRLTRKQLPPPVEEFAAEHDLKWSHDRDYAD